MPWLALCFGMLMAPPLVLLGIGYPRRFPARRTRAMAWLLLVTATALPLLGLLWAVSLQIYLLLNGGTST